MIPHLLVKAYGCGDHMWLGCQPVWKWINPAQSRKTRKNLNRNYLQLNNSAQQFNHQEFENGTGPTMLNYPNFNSYSSSRHLPKSSQWTNNRRFVKSVCFAVCCCQFSDPTCQQVICQMKAEASKPGKIKAAKGSSSWPVSCFYTWGYKKRMQPFWSHVSTFRKNVSCNYSICNGVEFLSCCGQTMCFLLKSSDSFLREIIWMIKLCHKDNGTSCNPGGSIFAGMGGIWHPFLVQFWSHSHLCIRTIQKWEPTANHLTWRRFFEFWQLRLAAIDLKSPQK